VGAVETKISSGAKGVLEAFEKWVEGEGGEGVVARSDENGWFKIKPATPSTSPSSGLPKDR